MLRKKVIYHHAKYWNNSGTVAVQILLNTHLGARKLNISNDAYLKKIYTSISISMSVYTGKWIIKFSGPENNLILLFTPVIWNFSPRHIRADGPVFGQVSVQHLSLHLMSLHQKNHMATEQSALRERDADGCCVYDCSALRFFVSLLIPFIAAVTMTWHARRKWRYLQTKCRCLNVWKKLDKLHFTFSHAKKKTCRCACIFWASGKTVRR